MPPQPEIQPLRKAAGSPDRGPLLSEHGKAVGETAQQGQVDRLRYRVQQEALAVIFAVGTGLWHRKLSPGHPRPPSDLRRVLRHHFRELIAADLANAEAGLYPASLLLRFPVSDYLRILPTVLADLPRVLRRKAAEDFSELPAVAADDRYPPYYRRTFHWQTDGWFSERSARIYDFQAEFLFFGTMDVMRRQALGQLARGLAGLDAPRIVDLACGTGRFLRQMKAALPRATLYGADLSPHYIQRAHQLLAEVPGVSLLVENVERLPLEPGRFDAVTCTFLLHEMPADARRRVAAEAVRLLRPGGLAVFQDSMQGGDPNGDDLAFFLDWFPRAYHEPYYKSYLHDPLEGVLGDVGLEVERSIYPLFSKVVVARKPS